MYVYMISSLAWILEKKVYIEKVYFEYLRSSFFTDTQVDSCFLKAFTGSFLL